MNQHYHVIARGRVQGVFFRSTVKKKADHFHLKGTVENLADGSVEIYVFGNRLQFDAFLSDLKANSGAALITDLIIKEIQEPGSYKDFSIIR